MTVTKAEKIRLNVLMGIMISIGVSFLLGAFLFYKTTIIFQAEQIKTNIAAQKERTALEDDIVILRESDTRYATKKGVIRSIEPVSVEIANLKENDVTLGATCIRIEGKLDQLILMKN